MGYKLTKYICVDKSVQNLYLDSALIDWHPRPCHFTPHREPSHVEVLQIAATVLLENLNEGSRERLGVVISYMRSSQSAPRLSDGNPSYPRRTSSASLPDVAELGTSERLVICLVSDFFYPRMGGVEMHQYFLAQGLIRRGHKVILVTGTYEGQRSGIRYMNNGLKVYYCPIQVIVQQASPPNFFTFLPLFRTILIRERVDIVHGHQTTSFLAHECILHAKTMGYKAVYTDHSLFGFADLGAVHVNKLLKFTLTEVDHAIAVSHTSRENLVLRAYLDPRQVSVIGNAVDTTKFVPDPHAAPSLKDRINIVILSRLVYRKGMDLVVDVIPEIAKMWPSTYFIIGGDGPKRIAIEEMREKNSLHERVELLGSVPHHEVRNVLVRGHIFLNCSLTEAFCIAILEAVSCGLYTVSTKVGGVPEVLPPSMISFAEPNAHDIVEALNEAITKVKQRQVRPIQLHREVRRMYNWHDVAEKTERVYRKVMMYRNESLFHRLRRYYECGPVAGKIFVCVAAVDYLLWRFVEWWRPRHTIDQVIDLSPDAFSALEDSDFTF